MSFGLPGIVSWQTVRNRIMKCSVFIATSVDGYIAKTDGSFDWLHSAGNQEADMSGNPDMGFSHFFSSVDCMVIGRKCMEAVSSMNLTLEQWPYGDAKIIVLSKSLTKPPANLAGKVEMYSGELPALVKSLDRDGFKHAYIDGGTTITSFLNRQLIDEMIITQVPVILGDGIPFFGKMTKEIKLENVQASAFANDYVQVKYSLKYL